MEQRLKKSIKPKNFIFVLSALTALLGIGVVFFSDLLIIPLAAFFALLLWFAPKAKILCALIPFLLLVLSFFDGVGGIFAIASALSCGLLLWLMYRFRFNKTDTVFAITAFFVFYLLIALFLSVGSITKEYNLQSVMTYLESFMQTQKESFVDAFSELHITDEKGVNMYLFTEETAEAVFLSVARLSVSFLIISAFVLCGLTCKIFSRMVAYAERDEAYIRAWRFLPPSIAAYFYIALVVLSFFVGSAETVFAIAIQNLIYIFMAVFAYVGLRHLIFVAAQAKRRGFFLLVVGFLLILLNVSALQILSFLGTYVAVISNRVPRE